MGCTVVLGMQWGDEGKGKIVDLVSPGFDAVVRYQGGHNAGHTVRYGDRHFALHLIPSGILRPEMRCVLGNGMVVHPQAFLDEVDGLESLGVSTRGRLFVSERAHLLLDLHVAVDIARENALGDFKIGTTSRGIGPAYEAKVARSGLRLGDLYSSDFERLLEERLARQIRDLGAAADLETVHAEARARAEAWRPRLEPYLCSTSSLLNDWLDAGRRLLFESAQGTLLDVDHGTYPFVTSSNSTAGYAATGSGVPPTAIDGVVGVLKAYTTRVGAGPFPTELLDDTGERIRKRGNEYGTTTGRPRRCGWLDLVGARYARRINGVRAIALTKLDVLDSLDEIPVCVGYRVDGALLRDLPSDVDTLARIEPELEVVPGWRRETVGLVHYDELPAAARRYVELIEARLEAPVVVISTGPRREETILRCDADLSVVSGEPAGEARDAF
ncbi:MAG TPA: adenylosuccinate synthase [Thermoanaerobaculia bacterium]|nr:adenylosuccinate synthase [Thermoanaerobaculia bacterium]